MKYLTSRRSLLCSATLGAITAGLGCSVSLADEVTKTKLTAEQALTKLKQGNANFLADKPGVAAMNHERRLELARNQAPFAVLVGCSDSRVPPEQLFGTSLGELFIVRNAGNTIDSVALGSIEYGVNVLGAPLIIVLGHERCGAVSAALSVVRNDTLYDGSIGKMIEPIIPAVLRASRDEKLGDDALLDAAVHENIRRTVLRLRNSEPSLTAPLKAGSLKIIGARYDLDTGEVDFAVA